MRAQGVAAVNREAGASLWIGFRIAPLAGAPLKKLGLGGLSVSDLTPLAQCRELEDLNLVRLRQHRSTSRRCASSPSCGSPPPAPAATEGTPRRPPRNAGRNTTPSRRRGDQRASRPAYPQDAQWRGEV